MITQKSVKVALSLAYAVTLIGCVLVIALLGWSDSAWAITACVIAFIVLMILGGCGGVRLLIWFLDEVLMEVWDRFHDWFRGLPVNGCRHSQVKQGPFSRPQCVDCGLLNIEDDRWVKW